MAARERQRDRRLAIAARRVSWPSLVLTGGVLLSLAANLAQAQPTAWGQVMAATPCAAFLVAVSMLERRAARHTAGRLVPGQDGPSPPVPGQNGALLALARRAAGEHQAAHGQPVTRDALRARLGVSNQAASALLRQLRASEGRHPPEPPHAA